MRRPQQILRARFAQMRQQQTLGQSTLSACAGDAISILYYVCSDSTMIFLPENGPQLVVGITS